MVFCAVFSIVLTTRAPSKLERGIYFRREKGLDVAFRPAPWRREFRSESPILQYRSGASRNAFR
jgi:hypothetical protein